MRLAKVGPWVLVLLLLGVDACQGSEGDAGGLDGSTPGIDVLEAGDGTVGGDPDSGVHAPSRWLVLPNAVNARDVGGYAVTGGGHIRWRVLLRGGQLSDLTAAGCEELTSLGVASVLDLRQADERASAPEATCVTDVSQVYAAPMPKILPPSAASYLALMDQAEAAVVELFSRLADPGAAPVYLHCVIGRDRASYAVALVLLALGASRATVMEEFLLSNDAGIAVDEAHLAAVLDEIDARGGVEAYLVGLGVPAASLTALRNWALE